MNKQEHDEISKAIADGYLSQDLEPLKCSSCESVEFMDDIKSTIAGHVAEMSRVCSNCHKKCGYWAYGGWEP